MTQRTMFRLQFVTASRDTLVTGNERVKPTGDGRWEHTVTLPFREQQYREFAAKAERKGAVDIRLSKRTAATAYGEWETVDCASDLEARIATCSLRTTPVLVHDDGSTTGGVDTLAGIRCDRCLDAPENEKE